MTLAEVSLKRPVTAVMFFISLTVIGLLAAFRLPLEFLPDIEAPFLFVNIPYPGSTPAEIERTITRPVEEVLATLPGVQNMNSRSRADGAEIFMEFKWGQNVATKAVEARDKIDAIFVTGQRWPELLAAYEKKAALISDADEKKRLFFEVAAVYESELHDNDRAIDAYNHVLELDPTDLLAIQKLDALYTAQGRWQDLLSVL